MLLQLRHIAALVLINLGSGTAAVAFALSFAGSISRGDLFLPYSAAAVFIAVGVIAMPWPDSRWAYAVLCAAAVFFGGFAAGWMVYAPFFIEATVGLAALAMLVCQAYAMRARPASSALGGEEMPSLLIVAGLYEGIGAIALLAALFPSIIRAGLPAGAVAMVLLMMLAYRWHEYLERARAEAGNDVRAALERLTPVVMLGACLLPFVIYGTVLFLGEPWIAAAAGAVGIVSGLVWKAGLVLHGQDAVPATAGTQRAEMPHGAPVEP